MRGGRLCFVALALAGAGFVALTLPSLPQQMAVRFNVHGQADNWWDRRAYLAFLVLLGVLLPLGIIGLVAQLGATRPEALNLPGKDYWFAPGRRAEGVRIVQELMWWFACLMIALVIGMHGTIVAAHASVPPRLPLGFFLGLVAGFLLGLTLWARRVKSAMRHP